MLQVKVWLLAISPGFELSTPAVAESSLAGDHKPRFAMRLKLLLQITADDATGGDAAVCAQSGLWRKEP